MTPAFSSANPPQTGGRRQSNLVGKLDIGQTRIPLQRGENSAVNCVKFKIWHKPPQIDLLLAQTAPHRHSY
ncbi:hypothetical protein [Agrobacterium cavarae]|uniref:hypothetical protein n=1 Tax=Agrobacterium cavarae TaxID=2528239 RepID=UPI0035E4309E